MNDIKKVGKEVATVEMKAFQLQVLENIAMYKDGIFEMANFQPEDSGLPYGLWFDDAGKSRQNKHDTPRVKVRVKSDNLIPVSIAEQPEILLKGTQLTKAEKELKGKPKDEVFDYISANHGIMLKHWNGEISTATLFADLKK